MAPNVVDVLEAAVQLLRQGTKDAASCEDASLCQRVAVLSTQLMSLPDPNQATWKKLVQKQQVPLHLARAFCTAARYNYKSPATNASLGVLMLLLRCAFICGLLTEGAAVGPIAASMRQQLQQAGLLPQLAGVMAALAADLRSDTAALCSGGQSSEQLCSGVDRFLLPDVPLHTSMSAIVVHPHLRDLWGDPDRPEGDNSIDWLCDPSGHTEAALQLCTATLQHAGCVMKVVGPAVHRKAPQLAALLLRDQAARIRACKEFAAGMVHSLSRTQMPDISQALLRAQDPEQGGSAAAALQLPAQQQPLRQLLLSPHLVRWLVSWLALTAFWISSKESTGPQPGNAAGPQVLSSSARNSSSNSSSRAGDRGSAGPQNSTNLTPCQLQLLRQLGLSPHLAAMVECLPEPTMVMPQLTCLAIIFSAYHEALAARLSSRGPLSPARPGQHMGQQGPGLAADQQRWRFEQQLWQLLPGALLPCASSLLLPAATGVKDLLTQVMDRVGAQGLIEQSTKALTTASLLQARLNSGSIPVGPQDSSSPRPPPAPHSIAGPAWIVEVLAAALQLAKQVLPLAQEPHASATTAGDSLPGASSMGLAFVREMDEKISADCAGATTDLLSALVKHSAVQQRVGRPPSAADSSTLLAAAEPSQDPKQPPSSTAGDPAASSAPVPAVAERFGGVCGTLEAGLRVAGAAVQAGRSENPPKLSNTLTQAAWRLLSLPDSSDPHPPRPALALHMGLRGPEAHTAEQRQLYSLLSSVLKLGPRLVTAEPTAEANTAGTPPACQWGQEAASTCCLAAGQAAVWLLQPAGAAIQQAPGAAAVGAAPPAVQQAAEVQLLPSLVIFGRCCLAWAHQLQRQASGVVQSLAPGTPAPQQEQGQGHGGMQAPHTAVSVCIPGWPQPENEAPVATPAPCELEQLVGAVAAWVGALTSPEARAALAAAAGGDADKCRQELEALAAAQQALRQGMSHNSLSALAQQLQATGRLLSGVPVPLFCNNPACSNISGPAELKLVSGRQCLCSGCRSARYCGRQCQKEAWPQHKPVCRALAAEVKAAAATGSAGSAGSSGCE